MNELKTKKAWGLDAFKDYAGAATIKVFSSNYEEGRCFFACGDITGTVDKNVDNETPVDDLLVKLVDNGQREFYLLTKDYSIDALFTL